MRLIGLPLYENFPLTGLPLYEKKMKRKADKNSKNIKWSSNYQLFLLHPISLLIRITGAENLEDNEKLPYIPENTILLSAHTDIDPVLLSVF